MAKKNKRLEQPATKQGFHFAYITDFKPKNTKQEELIKKITDNQIIFVSGPAGTGKTYVGLKCALDIIRSKGSSYKQLLITKPMIEAGESLGFLPGNIDEKISPYLYSYYANMKKLIGSEQTKKLMDDEIVKVVPLAYMRGATFSDCVAIMDETQNTTIAGLKLFLSRMGENCKLIVMGDIDQTDLKFNGTKKSGLDDAFDRFKGIRGLEFMRFAEDDIVRHTILIELMKRYKKEQ